MKRNEWLAMVLALGLEILWYPNYQNNSSFYGQASFLWIIVPIGIGILLWQWDKLFKRLAVSEKLESPTEILRQLDETEEGWKFRENFSIPTHISKQEVVPIKGKFYLFTVETETGIMKMVTSALKNASPVFLSYYKPAKQFELGYDNEGAMIRQMVPKEKPDVLDILESSEGKENLAVKLIGGDTK